MDAIGGVGNVPNTSVRLCSACTCLAAGFETSSQETPSPGIILPVTCFLRFQPGTRCERRFDESLRRCPEGKILF